MDGAKQLLNSHKYVELLGILNTELRRSPHNVDALLMRSKLFTRHSMPQPALNDAELAVVVSKGSGDAQLRRAICLWRLDKVGQAKSLIEHFDKNQEADTWKTLLESSDAVVEEIPTIPEIGVLQPRFDYPELANFESLDPQLPRSESKLPECRTDWYQSADNVILVVYRKGLEPGTTEVVIDTKGLKIDSDEKQFHWSLELGNEILAEASSYELTPFKVEFVLKKKVASTWSSLTAPSSAATSEPRPNTPKANASEANASTANASKANVSYSKWEHFADDDKPENDNDPMAFFQNLYKDAAPDVQRAMMKSYVESNGTSLSTNWEEVSKGKVETLPPKDMEAKKW